MPDYYRYLKRARQQGGIFGYEIAWPHIRKLLQEGHGALFDDVDTWFYLRRRDMVAQAISRYRANASGVYQSCAQDESTPPVSYDGDAIARSLLRAAAFEYHLARFFDERELSALPLWYEDIDHHGVQAVVERIATGLQLPAPVQQGSRGKVFRRMSDALSDEFVDRFSNEYAPLVSYWAQGRGSSSPAEFARQLPQYAELARGL